MNSPGDNVVGQIGSRVGILIPNFSTILLVLAEAKSISGKLQIQKALSIEDNKLLK
jgi:hypothetical protein